MQLHGADSSRSGLVAQSATESFYRLIYASLGVQHDLSQRQEWK
jgi:hypothetical protein